MLTSSHLDHRNVLITGATGFVGQHLTRYLLKNKNISIRILVRSMRRVNEVFGADKNLFNVIIADLADPDSLNNVCRDVEIVFHVASLGTTTPKSKPNSRKYNRINVIGTRRLASEALKSSVQRFVYVSSTGAMGTPSDQVITEKSACQPKSQYQISKRAAEKELLDLYHKDGLNVTILRPCLVAGAGKRGGELLKLFKLCRKGIFPIFSGKLDVEKPIIWIDDVVQAMVRASAYGRAGEIYLITSGKNYKLGEILQVAGELVNRPKPFQNVPLMPIKALSHIITPIAKIMRFSPPISPDRLEMFIANRNIDITKAREELGYNPEQQDVFDMLARTYEYYVQTGQL